MRIFSVALIAAIIFTDVTNAEENTSTRVEQAKSEQRKAESLARQNLETIRLEVHNAYINLKIAEENIKITSEAVEEAREKFLIAQVHYEEGEDTIYR